VMRPAQVPLAAALMGVAVACGGDGEPEGYGPELRAEFVEDCTATGTDGDVCRCFYASLEAEVPFERYQRIEERVEGGGDVPRDIAELAAGCDAGLPPTTTAPSTPPAPPG
jgi:hypothetical protein